MGMSTPKGHYERTVGHLRQESKQGKKACGCISQKVYLEPKWLRCYICDERPAVLASKNQKSLQKKGPEKLLMRRVVPLIPVVTFLAAFWDNKKPPRRVSLGFGLVCLFVGDYYPTQAARDSGSGFSLQMSLRKQRRTNHRNAG